MASLLATLSMGQLEAGSGDGGCVASATNVCVTLDPYSSKSLRPMVRRLSNTDLTVNRIPAHALAQARRATTTLPGTLDPRRILPSTSATPSPSISRTPPTGTTQSALPTSRTARTAPLGVAPSCPRSRARESCSTTSMVRRRPAPTRATRASTATSPSSSSRVAIGPPKSTRPS